MKKVIYCLILIIMVCSLSSCSEYSTELVWVVPESYLPNENAVNDINNILKNMGCDYRVRFLEIPFDEEKSYTEQIKELLDLGEKMDIIYSGSPNSLEADVYNSAYYRFGVEGIFEPLGEFMKTESGEKLIKIFPAKHLDAMKINGEIYGINGALTTLSTDNVFLVNDNNSNIVLDTERIYSLNGINELIKEADIPENVAPVMIFSQYLSYYYFNNCTSITDCIYITNDNKIIFSLDDDKYIQHLIQCKKMQDEGILIDGNGNVDIEDFYLSFEDCVGGYELCQSFNDEQARKPYIMVPLENENFIRFSNLGTGISSKSTEKEKAFELLSLCFANREINNLLVFGKENENYVLQSGIPINTDRYENLRVFSFGNRLICYPLAFESENKKYDYFAAYDNATVPDCMGFIFDDSAVKEQVVITNHIINEFYITLIKSNITADNTEDLIEEYKNLIEKNGLQNIIDELQSQYSSYISDKGE